MGVFFFLFMDMKAPKYQQCQGNSPHQASSCGSAREEPEKAFLSSDVEHSWADGHRARASEVGSAEETAATKTKSAPSEAANHPSGSWRAIISTLRREAKRKRDLRKSTVNEHLRP